MTYDYKYELCIKDDYKYEQKYVNYCSRQYVSNMQMLGKVFSPSSQWEGNPLLKCPLAISRVSLLAAVVLSTRIAKALAIDSY